MVWIEIYKRKEHHFHLVSINNNKIKVMIMIRD